MTANKWSLGIQPINWSNDDFHDLGGEIPLEQCLGEMQEAGYEGTELGHKFPTDDTLQDLLASYGLRLASGWHSTYLLSQSLADEEASFLTHLDRLKACGSEVVIVAECTDRTYDDRISPFDLSAPVASLERLCRGLDRLSELAAGEGFRVAYHHHLGTVIQNEAEILALLDGTQKLGLALDTGHLTAAGVDPVGLIQRHGRRVAHVHFKNVRPAVVADARAAQWSFERAVREGIFTVPGDGDGVDFAAVTAALEGAGYEGWVIVEAEQDPEKANPLENARLARTHLTDLFQRRTS